MPDPRARRLPPTAPRRSSASPSPRRRPSRSPRGSLPRTESVPDIPARGLDWDGDDIAFGPFPRFLTCTDLCLPDLLPPSPLAEGGRRKYLDNLKVVVSVVVEESPGPVKVLVKLEATVAEIIKAAIQQYSKEGRSPPLGFTTPPSFKLYHSHFSIEGLDEAKRLVDVGGRNFYLCKRDDGAMVGGQEDVVGGLGSSDGDTVTGFQLEAKMLVLFIVRRIRKIGRKMRRIWLILGCLDCGG